MKKLVFTMALFPILAFGHEYNSEVEVKQLLSFTADRPHAPTSQDMTRVYFKESAGWDSQNCRSDAADLRKDDEHTLSTLLFAWASGKSIAIGVDSRRKPYDNVCQVVWLRVM